MRIAVVAVKPQGVTDYGERLMAVLFLLGKDTAQEGTHSQGGEDACGEPGAVDLLRRGASGKLVLRADVPPERGKGVGFPGVNADLAGGDGSVLASSQVIPQHHQAFRVVERQRP
jgi:hypothetical protein